MIDKEQVIIDGVDVSGCKHYKINGKCRIPHYQQGIRYVSCNCDEWDCYYKQLQKEKFENLNNKQMVENAENLINENSELYKSLKEKEQIIINGIVYYKQQDINKGLDEEHYITEFHLLATHYNLLLEDYARKAQECEELKEKQKIIGKAIYKESIELCNENARYRKALEEIEEVIEFGYREYTICGEYNERCSILENILDIIDKTKGRLNAKENN